MTILAADAPFDPIIDKRVAVEVINVRRSSVKRGVMISDSRLSTGPV